MFDNRRYLEFSLGNLWLEVLDELVTLLVHKPEGMELEGWLNNIKKSKVIKISPEHHLGQAISFAAEEVLHLDVEPLHVDRHVGVLHNLQFAIDHVHLGHARDGGPGEGG